MRSHYESRRWQHMSTLGERTFLAGLASSWITEIILVSEDSLVERWSTGYEGWMNCL